ncbi:hypothetical protein RYH80_17525 [Halobaculum sp. MBLA0147]|uniref:hypothetical protein n=1 Tax=Halobaculum sp. MBLA0147 TaxID=3079934 RepID=UPI003525BB16
MSSTHDATRPGETRRTTEPQVGGDRDDPLPTRGTECEVPAERPTPTVGETEAPLVPDLRGLGDRATGERERTDEGGRGRRVGRDPLERALMEDAE